ncbi:MAG: molybdopterin-dependent oxidoreductase, partial [Nitrospirae bacterium]|nr:molybdopterin-dependent oxidoreductase [Nitrospirota bacterium]
MSSAKVNGESAYSDATFLVRQDTGEFARNGDGDILVWSGGQAFAAGGAPGAKAELDPGTVTIDGVEARTVWSLLVDRVFEHTIEEYAAVCGVDADLIAELARDFSSAGKRAVADFYRGLVQHTNGTYNVFAITTLNMLNGNFDWKGGYTVGGSHWHEMGGKVAGQVSLSNVPDGHSPAGVPISRHKKSYEKDAPNLFARDGFPAKRPWTPFNKDWAYHEIVPSIKDGYPYQVEVLITYWNDLLYSTPAARALGEQVLADESKLKLFVAFDILIGETAKLADYILPDSTWLERWSTPHISPSQQTKASGFRQPIVGSFNEQVVDGKTRRFYISPFSKGNVAQDFWNGADTASGPQLMEDIMIALGGRLGLPGVGAGAFDISSADPAYDWRSGLYSGWDWYLNILNNFSVETGGIPVDEIAAKGGAFEPLTGDPNDPDVLYDGDFVAHKFGKIIHFYHEALATTRDSMTGEFYDPLPKQLPTQDAMGREIEVQDGFDFHLLTYRRVYHAQARTIANAWLQGLEPENFIEINST